MSMQLHRAGFALAILLFPSQVLSHLVLSDPAARNAANGLIDYPCGGVPAGAPSSTYAPGSEIEISVDLVVEHVNGLQAYISFDNFATRIQLASVSTSGTGKYGLAASLPLEEGPAVIQATDGTYVSCADVVLSNGSSFTINPGLNDAWFDPDTAGQGFLVVVFPPIQQVFLAWFTFDAERPPEDVTAVLGDPGHRWLTAQGPFQANKAVLDIVRTEGGVFDREIPVPRNSEPGSIGTIELEFTDCSGGVVRYDMPGSGFTGEVPIRRIVDDNVVLCEALSLP